MTDNAFNHLTVDLPNSVKAEVISLSSIGKTALEYVEQIFKNGDKPVVIAMNKTNGDLFIKDIEHRPKHNPDLDTPAVMDALSGTRIAFNDMISDDHIIIYRKPVAQSVSGSILEEMNKLLREAKVNQEVGEYLQNLEDTGFFKDDK